MRSILFAAILLFWVGLNSCWSQVISVDDSFDATALIQTKLINSPCASVENFTSSGGNFPNSTNKSFGYFEKNGSNFPFQNGIVLTSSRAVRSVGPNTGDLSQGTTAWLGDADLEAALNTTNTFNATIIEFNFTPLSANFSFNYIFASEEYTEGFPCIYSDGFAFLLKPVLGAQPYQNLAVIPNTTIPVSSTSIRPAILANTGVGPGCSASNLAYFAGYNDNIGAPSAINYNGQTVVMTAKANVVPGVKYHIKLVVADQDDARFDSAIFIEGGSFNISANLGPNRTLQGGNPVCGNANLVLDATIPGTNTCKWFRNNILLPLETQPMYTASQNGVYKVQITIVGSTCVAESEVTLQFAPAFNLATKTIKQCDTDLDLVTNVNLKQIEPEIISDFANCTFKYYQNETAANSQNANFLIANSTAYNNVNGNEVWVRVQNAYGCVAVIKLTLVISATQLPANYNPTLAKCDDFIDVLNDDKDGISKFDLSLISASLATIIPNSANYQIKYYKTESDFNMEIDAQGNSLAIQNSQNYRNIGFPNSQTIWIKVLSNLDSSCFGFGKINLIVEKIPSAFAVSDIRGCDDNPNDTELQHAFDTSLIQNTVLGNQNAANFTVTYYDENNVALQSPLPNPFTTKTQKIRIRVSNKNGVDPAGKCWRETFLQFTVDEQPIANPIIVPAGCSTSTVGAVSTFGFNTSDFTNTILGLQTGLIVKYFDANNLPINPLPNPFFAGTQTIKAVVENPQNTNCTDSTLIKLNVNPSPDVNLLTENYICFGTTNNILISSGLNALNIAGFTFKWLKDGIEIASETDETLFVDTDGIYVCEVTNIQSGCTTSSTNKVVFSEKATINSIEIIDLLENNSINVSVSGRGTYEYSIDEPNGPFQSTGFFANISPYCYSS